MDIVIHKQIDRQAGRYKFVVSLGLWREIKEQIWAYEMIKYKWRSVTYVKWIYFENKFASSHSFIASRWLKYYVKKNKYNDNCPINISERVRGTALQIVKRYTFNNLQVFAFSLFHHDFSQEIKTNATHRFST